MRERKALWQKQLGPLAADLDADLDAIVEAFALDAREIRDTAAAIEDQAMREAPAAGRSATPPGDSAAPPRGAHSTNSQPTSKP